jgi:hypothetical protein
MRYGNMSDTTEPWLDKGEWGKDCVRTKSHTHPNNMNRGWPPTQPVMEASHPLLERMYEASTIEAALISA